MIWFQGRCIPSVQYACAHTILFINTIALAKCQNCNYFKSFIIPFLYVIKICSKKNIRN